MAKVNEVKKAVLQKQNGGNGSKEVSPYVTIRQLLERMKPEIQKALPKHLDPDRLTRIALTEIRRNPQLLNASQASLLGAIMTAAQLGLEPGPLGHVYLIPYYNTKLKSLEVQLQIGYKGLLELVRRSGQIEMIDAHVVYENDEFDYQYGLEPKLYHKPALTNRGQPIAVYAVAKFKDGGYSYLVMSVDEIEAIRKRSKSPDRGPWVTDWEEMARKTVVKRLCKYLPLSVEVQRGLAADETTKRVTEETEDILDEPDETDWPFTLETEAEEVETINESKE